jgi:hypothetical protein
MRVAPICLAIASVTQINATTQINEMANRTCIIQMKGYQDRACSYILIPILEVHAVPNDLIKSGFFCFGTCRRYDFGSCGKRWEFST